MSPLKIGFIPLTDCAPLVIALELGFFKKFGLEVQLQKFQRWDQIVRHLAKNQIQAAQLLITIPIENHLGLLGQKFDLEYSFCLSQNANGVTVSNQLWKKGVVDLPSLGQYMGQLPTGQSITLGVVSERSTHEMQLRNWLAKVNLEVGDKIKLVIYPPQEMVHHLREGVIDGFCAGEPWNQKATTSKLGVILATSENMVPLCAEKILGVRTSWRKSNEQTYQGTLKALFEACKWLNASENVHEATKILATKKYINTQESLIYSDLVRVLDGGRKKILRPQKFLRFSGDLVNYPRTSHLWWYFLQFRRWGYIPKSSPVRFEPSQFCNQRIYNTCIGKNSAVNPE